jgi:hypothetical protein
MGISERREFMTWYNDEKKRVFDNKLILEKFCQDDVSLETSLPDIQTGVYRLAISRFFSKTLPLHPRVIRF